MSGDPKLATTASGKPPPPTDAHNDWVKQAFGIDPQDYASAPAPGSAAPANATPAGDTTASAGSATVAADVAGADSDGSNNGAAAAPGTDGSPTGAMPGSGDTNAAASDGSSLINNPNFEHLIEAMEADAEEADTTWKSQAGNAVFDRMSADVASQYKSDGAEMDKARGNFNQEWNKIVFKKGGDAAKLLAAYDIYSLRIGALQMSNARIEALISVDLIQKTGPIVVALVKIYAAVRAEKLGARLKALSADLDKADTAITKAEVKMTLNIAISAVALVAAPEAALARIAVPAGAIVAHLIVDNALNHGTVKGAVVFVAGDGTELAAGANERVHETIEELGTKGKVASKSLGVAAAALTAYFDYEEVKESKELLQRIKEELEATQKEIDQLLQGLLPFGPILVSIDQVIASLNAAIQAALDNSADAAKNYDAIRQEIVAAQSGS